MATEYDAIWVGSDQKVSKTIIDASLSGERHRALLLSAMLGAWDCPASPPLKTKAKEIELVVLQSEVSGDKQSAKAAISSPSFPVKAVARLNGRGARNSSRLHVTSLLILPAGLI